MLTEASSANAADYRRDLGDGLVLRWSTIGDTENLMELVSRVFRDKEDDPPNTFLARWVRRLMSGDHPLMGSNDYGLVEDTRKEDNPIVACVCLMHQRWTYEEVSFAVGRPEIVACDPAYRKRGLIRAIFEIVHARSQAEGHLVQGITGIPYFYRQFGYEYALDLGGHRMTYLAAIPKLKEGQSEAYTLRPATPDDIPTILACYNRRGPSSIVWAEFPEQYLRYTFSAIQQDLTTEQQFPIQMILDVTGAVQGYVWCAGRRWGRALHVESIGTLEGVNLMALVPTLLRALQAYGAQMPTVKPDVEPFSDINFDLGRTHPVYDVLGENLAPAYEQPYAWYIRVADVPAFLRHITPALEQRLLASPASGYTGELKIDLYRSGLRLVFEQGRLTTIEPWQKPVYQAGAHAGFPPLVFLQLLFGRRSLDELGKAFPDVWVTGEMVALLNALFPARPSYVWPLN